MGSLQHLLTKNQAWAQKRACEDPKFFPRLAALQSPKYLWIGCADSRIPASEILGLDPGEVFVHRNVANLCVHSDINCLSVLQYGVEQLKVSDIIVCGHYGCGGVAAAMKPAQLGLIDNWLRYIRDIYFQEEEVLKDLPLNEKSDRLVELNVRYQVQNVCHTNIIQEAWAQGNPLTVHGWVYDLHNGLIKDLSCSCSSQSGVNNIYRLKDF